MSAVDCRAAVIGASSGGFQALAEVLSGLGRGFRLPILVVQHLHARDDEMFAQHLARATGVPVSVPCDKEPIRPGCVHLAPAGYHMLVEADETISLSVEERVNWSRPAIDVLFASAARVWKEALVAVVLTGANRDGAEGARTVERFGGRVVAQDPASAECPAMPAAAIAAVRAPIVLRLPAIRELLRGLGGGAAPAQPAAAERRTGASR